MKNLYVIEILDRSLDKLAEIKTPYPINREGHILRFSNELSNYGECTFRIATEDPVIYRRGDIFQPHRNHIRIRRKGAIVWQGVITDNPIRNKTYIEITGCEYLFYLDKKRVKRDAETTPGDGKDNYRRFDSGTMEAAVTAIMTEMLAEVGSEYALDGMTIGTVENPDYPDNFTTNAGVALTGAWNFSDDVIMQFDYHSILHVLKSFGAVANTDFYIDNDLVFHFKKFVGTKDYNAGFVYGTHGNIIDYDVPRYGKRMVNDYYGLASDEKGKLLRLSKRDTSSVSNYGLMEGSTAFSDVINQNVLVARLTEDLRFLASPATAPLNLVVDDKTMTLGTFGIGDIRYVRIKDHIIDYSEVRRIVGITTIVHNTGKELVTIQTNEPRPADIA